MGAFCFGIVIALVTREVLFRAKHIGLSHLGAIVGVIGGAGITALFGKESLFGAYCIGLALPFVMGKEPMFDREYEPESHATGQSKNPPEEGQV